MFKDKKRLLALGLTFMVIVFVLLSYVNTPKAPSESTQELRDKNEKILSPTTEPQPSISGSQQEKEDIEKRIRSSESSSQIEEVKIIDNFDGTYNATVYFEIICNDASGCERNAKLTSGFYYYEIFKNNNPKIITATIAGKFETIDKYGNESKSVVFQTQLSNVVAEKINWQQDKALLQVQIIPGLWVQQKNDIEKYFQQ